MTMIGSIILIAFATISAAQEPAQILCPAGDDSCAAGGAALVQKMKSLTETDQSLFEADAVDNEEVKQEEADEEDGEDDDQDVQENDDEDEAVDQKKPSKKVQAKRARKAEKGKKRKSKACSKSEPKKDLAQVSEALQENAAFWHHGCHGWTTAVGSALVNGAQVCCDFFPKQCTASNLPCSAASNCTRPSCHQVEEYLVLFEAATDLLFAANGLEKKRNDMLFKTSAMKCGMVTHPEVEELQYAEAIRDQLADASEEKIEALTLNQILRPASASLLETVSERSWQSEWPIAINQIEWRVRRPNVRGHTLTNVLGIHSFVLLDTAEGAFQVEWKGMKSPSHARVTRVAPGPHEGEVHATISKEQLRPGLTLGSFVDNFEIKRFGILTNNCNHAVARTVEWAAPNAMLPQKPWPMFHKTLEWAGSTFPHTMSAVEVRMPMEGSGGSPPRRRRASALAPSNCPPYVMVKPDVMRVTCYGNTEQECYMNHCCWASGNTKCYNP